MKLFLASWLALALSLAFACDRSNPDDPVGAYMAFVHASRKQDAKGAYGLLSAHSKEALDKRARDMSTTSGGALKDDPAALLLGAAQSPLPQEVKLASREGDRATLDVISAGNSKQVKLVKEPGGWKLELGVAE